LHYVYGAMWLALEKPGQTHKCLSRVVLNWLWWKYAGLCCPQSYDEISLASGQVL
jgi:hypothetical protein